MQPLPVQPIAVEPIPVEPIPAPLPAAVPQPAASVNAVATPVTAHLAGGRWHSVQSGETLWSIARALLGGDASPAAVAGLVDRLWELNADRIRSGDPDLIAVGERILLPRGREGS